MKILFKIIISALILVISRINPIQAQLEPFGLQGETINAIALFPSDVFPYCNYLCAGSDSNGVFIRDLDSANAVWTNLGLGGRKITALHVYHWGVGPGEFNTIFVGVRPDRTQGDSILLYRHTFQMDSLWMAADSGLDANSINQIDAISGFFFLGHSSPQPIFAAGGLEIFRAMDFPFQLEWDSVWNGSIGFLNVIHIHKEDLAGTGTVWAGGENAALAPVIMKSTDQGMNWEVFYPNLGGDNACNSLAVDSLHPNTVYAGMEGAVIKTVDGGQNWTMTSLQNTPYYFYGLVINPDNSDHLVAGGSTNSFEFGLFETFDGGNNWTVVLETDTILGISAMDAQMEGNEFVVYMGTLGDGVYRYKSLITKINRKTELAENFALYQNYPNPFNPGTTISWQLAVGSRVELAIYNLLGQKVRTLVNARQPSGSHQVEWDGRDDAGKEITSGVYFYRLQADTFVKTRKLVLLK